MSEVQQPQNVLTGSFDKKKCISFIIAVIITAILWNLPPDVYGIKGLTIIQERIIAMFAFATILWISEAIPAWATSISLIGIMLFTVSDSSFKFMVSGIDKNQLISHESIMATMADPIVILFLGGFILALAASKSGLDTIMARNLIKPFGHKSENVLLGFLFITGVFSMFVSNTATAAMMLTFLTPVFKALPANGKGRIALTMAIPVGANIGGMGTIIGTPPNAIALKYLNDPQGLNLNMGFLDWSAFMMPYTIIMLFIGWLIIKSLFPFTQKTIELQFGDKVEINWRTWVVGITFIITVLLWIFGKQMGVNSNTAAMLPIVVFAVTGVINAKDLQELNWSVLWMVAGGFALGLALNDTGLAENAIASIPFGNFSPIIIMIISGLICYFLSNFISNTATAALLMPILAVVCRGMGHNLNPIGGTTTVLIGIAIAASAAMCLPISTPPNAIAHSTGLVEQRDMLKVGASVGIIALILGYLVVFTVGKLHLFW